MGLMNAILNMAGIGGSATINGRTFRGGSINIQSNGRVIVDGVEQPGEALAGPITVHVEGDCGSIECGAGDVTVAGNVGGDICCGSGDVLCADVRGSVTTGAGDIACGRVGGSARTGAGDVTVKG